MSGRQAAPTKSTSGPTTVVMLAAIIVAIGFRVWRLDELPALNGDEAWSGVQALRLLRGETYDLRTPTGNPLNVFFLGPLVALHALLPGSTALLRSVSVASGLAALGLNYVACRRTFDPTIALVSTWLLAVLPVNIVYSRFAWDASQTTAATAMALYLAIAAGRSGGFGRYVALCVAFAAAVVVHPTNLFLAPVLGALLAPRLWSQTAGLRAAIRRRPRTAVGAATVVVLAAGVGLVGASWFYEVSWAGAIGRAGDPGEAFAYGLGVGRLFTGASTLSYLGGIPSPLWIAAADFCAVLAGLAAAGAGVANGRESGARPEATSGSTSERGGAVPTTTLLALGLAAALLAFYLVAGVKGVRSNYERYALWAVAPTCLWLAATAVEFRRRYGGSSFAGFAAALGISAVLLGATWGAYLRPYLTTGGDSHLTFRTTDASAGSTDPKRAALAVALEGADDGRPPWVVSRGWWTRWTLEYAARCRPGTVRFLAPGDDEELLESVWREAWFVELAGVEEEAAAARGFAERGLACRRTTIVDRSGRPVATVLKAAEFESSATRPEASNGLSSGGASD